MLINFTIALEGLHDDIEILREGNIVDIADTCADMLDVDLCHIIS